MRLRFLLASCSLFCLAIFTMSGQTPPEKAALELCVQTSKDRYKPGDIVPVRIEFKNRGTYPIKLGFTIHGETGEDLSIYMEMLDSEGKRIRPRIGYDISIFSQHTARDFWITLKPEHFYGWDISLVPYIYDCLNKPGTYQIRVLYEYHPPNEQLANSHSVSEMDSQTKTPPIFAGNLESNVRFSITEPNSP